MALTVQTLITPVTAAQLRQQAVTILTTLGLQPNNWAQGGIASSILTVACNILANISTLLANAIAANWNPTATGGYLQLLSQYFYGVTPPQATFASGNLVLTNSGGGVYTYAAGTAFFQSVTANAQGVFPTYTNTAPFTLNALSTLTIPIQCTFAGTGGNAAPGTITQVPTAMLLVTATNPTALAGSDALSDQALRQLNIDSIGAQSVYGPRTVYAYAVQTAVNSITGSPVNINRWLITEASHTGTVNVVVASPSGPALSTDVAGVVTRINEIARPDAVTVNVSSATAVNYSPTSITVYVLAPQGTLATTLQTTIEAALVEWFASPANPIGGITAADDTNASFTGIFESGVTGVIAQAVATVTGCVMLSTRFTGTSDVALSGTEVAVDDIGNIIVNVQFVGT